MSVALPEAPLRPRDGLGEVGRRLSREPCTIGYLGASVTEQRSGYRPRLHEAIQRRFGQDHRPVTAAVGGVGAVSAVFLMDMLVLPRRPDLCIVEYSSGDMENTTPLSAVEAAVEGIVAKLRAAGCAPCFLHLHRTEWTPRCEQVVAAWERVAERHGVPTIDAGEAMADLIRSGEMDTGELFRDVIHTTRRGSELLASVVCDALTKLADLDGPPPAAAAQHGAHGPAGGEYSRARVAAATPADGGGIAGRFRLVLPLLQLEVDEPVRPRLGGQVVGLVVIRDADSGEVAVAGDRGEERLAIWDQYCWRPRLGTVLLAERRPAGERITITLLGPTADRRPLANPAEPGADPTRPGGTTLKLVGYMVLGGDEPGPEIG